jgi:predicted RNA binding protein YcfA (HicA-like mRNA interferase family)
MKLPRDLNGAELIKKLKAFRYRETRQTGSHVRLTCEKPEEHHLTVPKHDALRVGTLAAILADVAAHHHFGAQRIAQAAVQKALMREDSDDPIMISALQRFSYCLRQCALIHLEQEFRTGWVSSAAASGRIRKRNHRSSPCRTLRPRSRAGED